MHVRSWSMLRMYSVVLWRCEICERTVVQELREGGKCVEIISEGHNLGFDDQ